MLLSAAVLFGLPRRTLGVPGTFALVLRSCWSLSQAADPPSRPGVAQASFQAHTDALGELYSCTEKRGVQSLEVFAVAARWNRS